MLITGRNEVVAKVMFLLVSVILSTGGSASVHAGILPHPQRRRHPLPCQGDPPDQGDPPAKETPLPRRPPCQGYPLSGPHPMGKLRGIRSRPTPKGEIEGDQIQAHTQGGKLRGIRSRPTPKGKLRGIRSRPTPNGEIEGDQIQAHTQGENWGGSDPGPHPRGKLRGIRSKPPPPRHTVNERPVRILLECILVWSLYSVLDKRRTTHRPYIIYNSTLSFWWKPNTPQLKMRLWSLFFLLWI